MGISGISSMNNMSVMQMTPANVKDQKSKNIQNEITDVEQQIQKLSSKQELSVNEKADEKKKLQKEKSSLNTELEQHQQELLRSQKREIMLAGLRENQKPAKEEDAETKVQATEISSDKADEKNLPANEQQPELKETVIAKTSDGTVILKEAIKEAAGQDANAVTDTEKKQTDEAKKEVTVEKETKAIESDEDEDKEANTSLSNQEMHAMVSANTSAQQADRLGTIVAKTNDGIAILKGEISQDERRGVDTERKQAELEQMEKKAEQAATFQFSVLGDANNAMTSSAETAGAGVQISAGNNAYAAALNATQKEQAQQRFQVSIA